MANALVFGGGGGKGAYEIGVWKALRELGVERAFSCVIGTSVGALNAALFAQKGFAQAEEIWSNLSDAAVLPSNFMKGGALASSDGLAKILLRYLDLRPGDISAYVCCSRIIGRSSADQGLFDIGTLDPLCTFFPGAAGPSLTGSKPFGVDLMEEYAPEYIRLNPLPRREQIQYLLASAALPFAFDPVEINGICYRDGGIIPEHNLPYQKAAELGYQRILAISLNSDGITREIRCGSSSVLIFHPTVSLGTGLDGTLDFNAANSRRRISLGYQDAMSRKGLITAFLGEDPSRHTGSILTSAQRRKLETIFKKP